MKIKSSASLSGLKLEMRVVLRIADEVFSEYGYELIVTSGTDGTHSPGSLHYYGYAIDFRTRHMDDQDKLFVTDAIKTLLGDAYDVVLEDTHLHVEYQEAIK